MKSNKRSNLIMNGGWTWPGFLPILIMSVRGGGEGVGVYDSNH